MFKYDTHIHTKEGSACASATGAEQAVRYKELGYSGIFITDHFFNGNTAVRDFTDWYDRVDQYCLGYEHALEEGNKIGLKVFFGIEYSYCTSDLLVYGIDKQWLYKNSDCLEIPVYDFIERVHKSGGMIIHAHPFRQAGYIREMRLLPDYVDGVEVYNSGNATEAMNERALWYAKQFGFKQTGGSDNHHLHMPAERLSGVLSPVEFEEPEDYINTFYAGKIEPIIPPKPADGTW